jgi:fatty-acyl-CoA synthase
VGVPDDRWGEAGCAWVVPETDSEVTADEVLALCKDKLARFKVPKHVFFCTAAELPTTPTGKVQKFELVRRATRLLVESSPTR